MYTDYDEPILTIPERRDCPACDDCRIHDPEDFAYHPFHRDSDEMRNTHG